MFFNVPLKPVLTFLGSAPVSLWTGIGGSFGILGQVILSSPIKDISPVLSKTADPLILKTTNFILNMFKYKKKTEQEECTFYMWHFTYLTLLRQTFFNFAWMPTLNVYMTSALCSSNQTARQLLTK